MKKDTELCHNIFPAVKPSLVAQLQKNAASLQLQDMRCLKEL